MVVKSLTFLKNATYKKKALKTCDSLSIAPTVLIVTKKELGQKFSFKITAGSFNR